MKMSSNDSWLHDVCQNSGAYYLYTASTLVRILVLLPISVSVLCLGHQRWKQRGSSAAVTTDTDFHTYNLAVMELIGILGSTMLLFGSTFRRRIIMITGVYIQGFPWYAQMIFPLLLCMEHYLAVVHPITYMRLRKAGGVRIRYIGTVIVWIMCCGGVGSLVLLIEKPERAVIPNVFQLSIFLITMSFCSLSILCVLIRPRPGEVDRDKARIDQSKWRAFQTVTAIMGVLLFRFGGNLVCNLAAISPVLSESVKCCMKMSISWFNLPSSLLLPVLFLHRAGKLPCSKRTAGPGGGRDTV